MRGSKESKLLRDAWFVFNGFTTSPCLLLEAMALTEVSNKSGAMMRTPGVPGLEGQVFRAGCRTPKPPILSLEPERPKHISNPEPQIGGCQNYGPFFGPYYNTAPNI